MGFFLNDADYEVDTRRRIIAGLTLVHHPRRLTNVKPTPTQRPASAGYIYIYILRKRN